MQEELQQEQTKAAIEVPPSIPLVNSPFVRSSDQAIAHSEAGSVESISPANVQLQLEALLNEDILPPLPPHIVQMEVEEIVRIEMSPSALVIPECIEEAPSLEGSIPVPLVHKKIAGSTEDLRIVEHPLVVQEGLDLNTINDPVNVQLQPEETFEAHLIMQEGDEKVQPPSTEPSDTPVQA